MKNGIVSRACAAAAGLFVAGLLAGSAAADEGAAEYRHHVMEAVGGHMQSIGDILRRKVPHADHLALHADAMADLAEITPLLFPEGSEGGDALPAIWQDPDDFADKVQAFRTAATGFQKAAHGEGEIGPAVQELGQACKSCHDSYREED